MINTSTEYKQKILSNREFITTVNIELLGGTILELSHADIEIGGLSITDTVSDSSSFTVGGAIIDKITLVLNNSTRKFDTYDFNFAKIYPVVGLQLSSSVENLQKGEFLVDSATAIGSIIVITGFTKMRNFDKPFINLQLTFPMTSSQLVSEICSFCNVPLASTNFPNNDFVITTRPEDEALTCREIIGMVAQIGCCFAKINNQGSLFFDWYNMDVLDTVLNYYGGNFDENTPYSTGISLNGGNFMYDGLEDSIDGGNFTDSGSYHFINSLTECSIDTDDVMITGVEIVQNEAKYFTGSIGYVISLEDNVLISALQCQEICDYIGAKLIGMKFRPLSVACLSDPSIESGDIAVVVDRKGNAYGTIISSTIFKIGNRQKVTCDAESVAKNNSTRYSLSTKTKQLANRVANEKISAYDLSMQQLTNLLAHSFGFYKTDEIAQDGSMIYYSHDKPLLSDSIKIWKQTIDAFAVSTDGGVTWNGGFDINGNAVVNILSAIGINADWINAGSLTVGLTSNQKDDDDNVIAKMLIGGGFINILSGLNLDEQRIFIGCSRNETSISPRVYIADDDGLITHIEAGFMKIVRDTGEYQFLQDMNTSTYYLEDEKGMEASWYGLRIYRDGVEQGALLEINGLRFDDASIYDRNYAYVVGEVSAESFIDRTPFYKGNALSEIEKIKDDGNGNIDHATLPKSTRKDFKNGHTKEIIEGRDIGASVSILTVAIQELIEKNKQQDKLIDKLLKKVEVLENGNSK